MKINFLENNCTESPINNKLFGLCDNQDGNKAYTDTFNSEKWIAIIKNDKGLNVRFTPIDKCLLNDSEHHGKGRCDGILTSDEHLYFVELKNQTHHWISDAIKQLESTIDLFKNNHEINNFKYKKAFVCNKRHRHFQEVDNESNLNFFRKHKVRLDIQAEILII